MHGPRKWLLAAAISVLVNAACFDGTDHGGSEVRRRRVRQCVYYTTTSGTFLGLASTWGWENWRDVFRPRDMLVEEVIILRCAAEITSATKTEQHKCMGFSYDPDSSYRTGGIRVESTLVGDLNTSRSRIGLKVFYLQSTGPKHSDVWMEVPSVTARQDKEALLGLLKTVDARGEPEVASWMKELSR
jgi:hypothetical protein